MLKLDSRNTIKLQQSQMTAACTCLLILFLFKSVLTQTAVDYISPHRFDLNVDGYNLTIPYSANYPVNVSNENIDCAIIVVHGTDRNSDDYYQRVLNPAKLANGADQKTIIIAPQFLIETDIEGWMLSENSLYWSSGGWKIGHKSQTSSDNPRPIRISSFAVVDTIIYRLATRNLNLTTIVVAGHSAGGQFVNRYAAGNQMEQILNSQFGIQVRYIVANPSSYVYFNAERHVAGSVSNFEIPSNSVIQSCPNYNNYKYGMDNLNSYMTDVGVETLKAQYQQRSVIYLLGELDNNPNSSGLDKSCSAMLQGEHRLRRGIIYFNYLKHVFGNSIANLHNKHTITGVGHSSTGIFASDCGGYYLFDYSTCDGLTPVEDERIEHIPTEFTLFQNYPNPFNPITAIKFNLPEGSHVQLIINNIKGTLVKTLARGVLREAGLHTVYWDGTNENGIKAASGLYFYHINTKDHNETKRMLLLK